MTTAERNYPRLREALAYLDASGPMSKDDVLAHVAESSHP